MGITSRLSIPAETSRLVAIHDLTPEAQEIGEHAAELASVTGDERTEVESIIEHARQNRPVHLQMSKFDLELIKKRAQAARDMKAL